MQKTSHCQHILASHILTLQEFVEEHPKPPWVQHGSLKDMFTETFEAFVKDVGAVM